MKLKHRTDYLSVCKNNALSAEGEFFSIGDKVFHEGDGENNEGIISKFSLNKKTMDVIAHTNQGEARICFLYKK